MNYAIDFGTSNTVVARINAQGIVETVKLEGLSSAIANNPPVIPSLVYVQDAKAGKVLVGQEVSDRGLDVKISNGEQRFFDGFKRAIGNPAPGFVPELDGQLVNFETLGSWFLQRIIAELPDAESLVFTVPVDSFEPYRQWLSGLCEQLKIQQVRLLDEPTAAALGYGLLLGEQSNKELEEQGSQGKKAKDDKRNPVILVIDFGGGTLDLSLVRLTTLPTADSQSPTPHTPFGFLLKWGDSRSINTKQNPQTAKVLAKAGENLGGIDIDRWIVDYFHHTQGLPKNTLVNRLAEKLKINLSTSAQHREVFFDDRTLASYELELDRQQFQQILEKQNFFTRLDGILTQVSQQASRQGVELSELDAVLLVGGTAQIPAVKDWAAQHFAPEKIKADKPLEAIAHGAISQNWEIQDFLYHSYGIRYWDKRYKRHSWHTIIKSGQTYPLAAPVELVLGASSPNQPSIELVIGELGETNMEVYFEGDRLITRSLAESQVTVQPLNDRDRGRTIAQLNPVGMPGRDRIKVQFTVDAQRTLRITVTDLLTDAVIVENQAVVQLV